MGNSTSNQNMPAELNNYQSIFNTNQNTLPKEHISEKEIEFCDLVSLAYKKGINLAALGWYQGPMSIGMKKQGRALLILLMFMAARLRKYR